MLTLYLFNKLNSNLSNKIDLDVSKVGISALNTENDLSELTLNVSSHEKKLNHLEHDTHIEFQYIKNVIDQMSKDIKHIDLTRNKLEKIKGWILVGLIIFVVLATLGVKLPSFM
jgi:dsDNA-specific endonuclease/ATPase MutS2